MYKKGLQLTFVYCSLFALLWGCHSDYLEEDEDEDAIHSETGNIHGIDSDTPQGGSGGDIEPGGTDTNSDAIGRDSDSNDVEVTLFVIETFDDNDIQNELGGIWLSYDDGFDDGDSVVHPVSIFKDGVFAAEAPGYGGSGYAAHVTGTTGSVFGWDYVGFLASTGPDVLCPNAGNPETDLTQFDGVQFLAKGTAIPFGLHFKLPHKQSGAQDNCPSNSVAANSLTSYNDFEFDFGGLLSDDWQLIRIPFNEMERSSGGSGLAIEEVLVAAKELVWELQKSGSEMDLWIDDVAFYTINP